jgi:hypothetical protein
MNIVKQEERRPENAQRELFFGIISQRELAWSEHNAEIVDIGVDGLRIETQERIKPGYVWFQQRIAGNRGGFLEWSMARGERHFARIRFVSLSLERRALRTGARAAAPGAYSAPRPHGDPRSSYKTSLTKTSLTRPKTMIY